MKKKVKVIAYITKREKGKRKLLVNLHRDFPDAGLQVPSGTVEENESIEEALFREVYEETGIKSVILIGKLHEYIYFYSPRNEYHYRHIYHMEVQNCPQQFTHIVKSADEDDGIVLEYFWMDINEAREKLAVNQGDFLHLLLKDEIKYV